MSPSQTASTGKGGEAGQNQKVRLDRLAYVHYQHPSLSEAHRFLLDFGLLLVEQTNTRNYYKGFGTAPCIYVAEQSPNSQRRFVGGAWVVESYEDLERAAALPCASQIEQSNIPGGGYCHRTRLAEAGVLLCGKWVLYCV